ncbi:hypothetical protein Bca52824_027129 [Brassica carinata]|uniref:Uncharacterized protein n=1 Tax=Brassica carinata TaxID=52824 RepID=A0A8X7VA60_BRACI|nr:hypothetical protein Bca52824_027129 [Brassica carinata]
MSPRSSACSFNIFIFRFVDSNTDETIARHANLIRISGSVTVFFRSIFTALDTRISSILPKSSGQ